MANDRFTIAALLAMSTDAFESHLSDASCGHGRAHAGDLAQFLFQTKAVDFRELCTAHGIKLTSLPSQQVAVPKLQMA